MISGMKSYRQWNSVNIQRFKVDRLKLCASSARQKNIALRMYVTSSISGVNIGSANSIESHINIESSAGKISRRRYRWWLERIYSDFSKQWLFNWNFRKSLFYLILNIGNVVANFSTRLWRNWLINYLLSQPRLRSVYKSFQNIICLALIRFSFFFN